MANLKTQVTRKQSTLSFPKKEMGQEIFFFGKIWRALFSCYLRSEICVFALLPTPSLSHGGG